MRGEMGGRERKREEGRGRSEDRERDRRELRDEDDEWVEGRIETRKSLGGWMGEL